MEVLGEHAMYVAGRRETSGRDMCRVRLGASHAGPPDEAAGAIALTGRGSTNEPLILDGIAGAASSFRAAVVWDSRFCADASAGEDDDALMTPDQVGEGLERGLR